MTDTAFVEVKETTAEFVRELKAGGTDARALQKAVTEGIVCDFSNVNNLLLTPELRHASEPIREQPPASALRSRAYCNITLNPESTAFDATSQFVPGLRSTLNLPVATKKMECYKPEGLFDTILTIGTDSAITINQTGVYRIAVRLNLAFYPVGLTANTDSNNWKGVSDNSLTQTPVQVQVAVRMGSLTRYVILTEGFLSKSDFELARARTFVGEATLQLTAGNSFTLNVARGPTMGMMRKSGAADLAEVLGLKKTRFVVPGSAPYRDSTNLMEIYRIA